MHVTPIHASQFPIFPLWSIKPEVIRTLIFIKLFVFSSLIALFVSTISSLSVSPSLALPLHLSPSYLQNDTSEIQFYEQIKSDAFGVFCRISRYRARSANCLI